MISEKPFRRVILNFAIILMAIAFMYSQGTQGGEMYAYTNVNGIKVLSNAPVSKKDERKELKIDSLNTMTPSEKRTLKNEYSAQQKRYKDDRAERGKLLLLYSIFR
jgi:hypothetical protein